VAVEVLPGPVVANGGARVDVPGGDLHVAQVDAGVQTGNRQVVTKECLSMCGCIRGKRTPVAAARLRNRRVAAWRSILAPRVLRRIGPESRPSTA